MSPTSTRLTPILALLAALVLTACHSTPVRIETAPPGPNEEIVGPVVGESMGIMLFQFIPIGQNERFGRAYDQALRQADATRLVNITIEEDWFWAWVLNGYTFRIRATAVRTR